ncbi:hypothetical protein HYU40_04230 [Candidatus Woesearchaeota archaeon]|nr:hypothetical protein [Candidatus Woesearchaeota archaeon]
MGEREFDRLADLPPEQKLEVFYKQLSLEELAFRRKNSELPKQGDIMFSYKLVPIRSVQFDEHVPLEIRNFKTATNAATRWHRELYE